MAIYRPSATIGAVSGALGGAVFRHAGAPTLAARPIRKQTASNPQADRQADYHNIQNAWRDLTDAQRLQWTQIARQNPIINRLGLPRQLTAQEYYTRTNLTAILAAGALQDTPEADYGAAPLTTLNIDTAQTNGIVITCFQNADEYALGTVIVRAAFLINKPLTKHPRHWRTVWGGVLTTGPPGGAATLYPNAGTPDPTRYVLWPEDWLVPTEDWTLVLQARAVTATYKTSPWVESRATITAP